MSLSGATATAPDATAMLAIDFCISVERQMNMDAPFDDYVAFESREREREYAIVTRSSSFFFWGGLLLSRPFPCLCSSLDRISLPHFTWLFDLNSPRLFNNSKVNSTHGGTGDIETATAIDVCVFIDGLFSPSVALRQRCGVTSRLERGI